MTASIGHHAARTHILRIVTRLNIGGPAIHVALLTKRLDPAQFSTTLVVGQPDATEGNLGDLLAGATAEVIQLPTLRRSLNPFADLATLGRLLRIVWTQRPGIVHTHMAKAGTLGRLAGLLYNRLGPGRAHPAVLIHTFHGHVLEGYFSSLSNRVFAAIERWLARRTDVLIAVSDTVRRDLLALGIGRPEQWRVVPVGLNVGRLAELPLPNGAPIVRFGMVGRLVPIKNPSLFLDAFDQTHRRAGPHRIEGVIVGDGPLRPSLEAETRRRGLSELVRFDGWQRDLLAVYGNLEVACLTSWNEGTPVAMIEAMAAGRAVVATNAGGVQDVLADGPEPVTIAPGTFQVTDRGVLVRPGDAEGLTNAMRALADDAPLRRRLGEAARAHVVGRFAEDRLIQDITALYRQATQATHAPQQTDTPCTH
jgi:glycosyltransferase involved in cell wall biosynthesis